jgi:hypothetical protein
MAIWHYLDHVLHAWHFYEALALDIFIIPVTVVILMKKLFIEGEQK